MRPSPPYCNVMHPEHQKALTLTSDFEGAHSSLLQFYASRALQRYGNNHSQRPSSAPQADPTSPHIHLYLLLSTGFAISFAVRGDRKNAVCERVSGTCA